MTEQQIQLGRINAAYGLKGWVKIYSHTDPIEQILSYSPWQLRKDGKEFQAEVDRGKVQGKGVIALLVGSLIALVVALAWRGRQLRPELLHMAVVAGGLFLIQTFIGAANVWLGFPLATKVLHLTVATGMWVAIAALAVLAYIPSRSSIGSHIPDQSHRLHPSPVEPPVR